MKKKKSLSDNTLGGLLDLMNEIDNLIKDRYLHISDNLPVTFIKMIEKIKSEVISELDEREVLY